jgi:hypothetical protein
VYSAIVTSTLIIQQLVEMTTGNPAILVHRALELAVDLGLPPAEFKRIEPAADHYASGLLEEALDGVDPDDAPVIAANLILDELLAVEDGRLEAGAVAGWLAATWLRSGRERAAFALMDAAIVRVENQTCH